MGVFEDALDEINEIACQYTENFTKQGHSCGAYLGRGGGGGGEGLRSQAGGQGDGGIVIVDRGIILQLGP